MKHCPVCGTEYDEEVIQFCTKDGSPLVEDDQPNFTAMPSESVEPVDEPGEETVIRRRETNAGPTYVDRADRDRERDNRDRIVIPATEPSPEQKVRTRPPESYYAAPPPPQNTGKVVALTILGTLAAIGFGALLFWLLSKPAQNTNVNINTNMPNMNLNTNGFDTNFNFNANAAFPPPNINFNTNLNTNVKTPTPTATPKPTPSATPTPDSTPTATPTPRPTGTPRPSATPTPRTGPRPPGNVNGQ